MELPSPFSPEAEVYRRIPPHWCSKHPGRVKLDAFIPDEGEGLSVFRKGIVKNARYILQHYIEKSLARLDNPAVDEKAKEKLRAQIEAGRWTVESIYRDVGWRVVALPVSAIPTTKFVFTPPEPDGHQNILGSHNDFLDYADDWVRVARMLTEEECLCD